MRLLTAVLPTVQRIFPAGHVLFTVGIFGSLAGLEILGRHTTSDREDGLAVVVLIGLFATVVLRHRRTPHPWLGWVSDRLQNLVEQTERLRNECGVDLRGKPPIPRRTPRWVYRSLAGMVLLLGFSIAAWIVYPNGWRDIGLQSSYVLYLLILGIVWTGLFLAGLACIYLPLRSLRGPLRLASDEDESRSTELIAWLGYLSMVSVLAWVTSPMLPLAMCACVVILAWAIYCRNGGDQASVLWQQFENPRVYSIPLHRVMAGGIGLGGLFLLGLLVLACGGRLMAPPDPDATMLVTGLLGAGVAWTIPGALAVGGARLWALRRHDPARRMPPSLYVTGSLNREDQLRLTRTVRAWGWIIKFDPLKRTPEDVAVAIVPTSQSEATEFDPRWPLKVSIEDLETGTVKDRLVRRDEILLRRLGFKGLKKLFKRVTSFRGSEGGGFLFAPHWWFIDGLTREDNERPKGDDEEVAGLRRVGPAFTKVWPARVRQHWHAVLRSTEIDLVFVEDGVHSKSLEKVMRAMLELYDVHGGKRKAEDYHFRGLTKVRVVIHEYAPGKSYDTGSGYAEPKFSDLTRLRILHVFKDKGDHEERVEMPADFSWEPQPLTFN